jgi:hypothetical protein
MIKDNSYYKFSGVDFDGEFVRVILDGIVYEFEEDPDDCYRSYMYGPKVVEKEVKNTFPEVRVRLVTDSNVSSNFEGIELFDAVTNKEVLIVGTDYSEEYYPVAYTSWRPENLVINQKNELN